MDLWVLQDLWIHLWWKIKNCHTMPGSHKDGSERTSWWNKTIIWSEDETITQSRMHNVVSLCHANPSLNVVPSCHWTTDEAIWECTLTHASSWNQVWRRRMRKLTSTYAVFWIVMTWWRKEMAVFYQFWWDPVLPWQSKDNASRDWIQNNFQSNFDSDISLLLFLTQVMIGWSLSYGTCFSHTGVYYHGTGVRGYNIPHIFETT